MQRIPQGTKRFVGPLLHPDLTFLFKTGFDVSHETNHEEDETRCLFGTVVVVLGQWQ